MRPSTERTSLLRPHPGQDINAGMSPRTRRTAPILATVVLASALAAPTAGAADPWTNWQNQIKAAIKKAQDQYKASLVKGGVNPTTPLVAKGFTVEIPVGGPGIQVGGIGVNQAGTAAAVAVGTALGGTGDLYLVDTIKRTTVKVPQGVSLPWTSSDTVSNDGRRVVFTSGLGIFAKPYVYTRNAAEAVPLATKNTGQPVISGDGKSVAFASDGGLLGKDAVSAGDAGTGVTEAIEVAPDSATSFGRPQISGDGRYVGYLVTTSTSVLFHTYDRRTKTLRSTDLRTEHSLPAKGSTVLTDWSWDGRWALVAQSVGSVRTLYVVDLKGFSRAITSLPYAAAGESNPTLSADAKSIALATPTPTDASDTNNATDLAWVNLAATSYKRQSFDAAGAQLTSGIGLTLLGQRVPRFAVSDLATAAFWAGRAPTGGGETVYVRTTLPVVNPPVATTPVATTPAPTTP